MIPTSLSTLAAWADGALIQGTPSQMIHTISTDSRKAAAGEVFVALKGEKFDAHEFLGDVIANEIAAMVVSQLPTATEGFAGGIIHVKSTLKALQSIAFHHRRTTADLRVVGVTGSNGKTSTKDFLNAVLSAAGPVNCTAGNLNNHIGLPLTILAGRLEDRFAVWEMGMNHPGEIEVLAEIAGPDVAVITNIGTAHIENMGSREAIAEEKSELPAAVPSCGYAVMPAEDEFFGFVAEKIACPLFGVGIGNGFVQAEGLSLGGDGRANFRLVSEFGAAVGVSLPVRGRHMVVNALLAAAVGLKEGIAPDAVAAALSATTLTGGRLQEKTIGGISVLDDSYNANPDSMAAALETLRDAEVTGRRVAVLGFMGELGEHEEPEHLRLGERVSAANVDALVTVGDRASLINRKAEGLAENHNFATHDEAAEFLRGFLAPGDLALFKGSRAAGMEKVIAALD